MPNDITKEEEDFIDALNRETDVLIDDLNEFFSNNFSNNAILVVCASTIRNLLEDEDLRKDLHPFPIYMVMTKLAETMGNEAVRDLRENGITTHPLIELMRKKYGR